MNCFVDYRITDEELISLRKFAMNIIKVPRCSQLYPAIDGHVDIQLAISNNKLIIQKDISLEFKDLLLKYKIEFLESSNSLEDTYPNNIGLNALITKNYFVHNLKYTDPTLLKEQFNKTLISVKQGYTKCSILPVSEKAIITNDSGIASKLLKYDFDVLLIPYGDIILPGFDYGFIGGVGGLITPNTMAFFGNLSYYKYGKDILKFLKKYHVEPVYLSNSKLYDRGSLLIL